MSSQQSGSRRDPEREKLWRDRIAAWEASGLTARAFCLEHDVGVNLFYVWRRVLRKRDSEQRGTRTTRLRPSKPASRFVAVDVVKPATDDLAASIEVVLPDSTRVRVTSEAEVSTISTVLRALREVATC